MNRRLATTILISVLGAIAISFGIFYLFVIRGDSSPNNITIAPPPQESPIYQGGTSGSAPSGTNQNTAVGRPGSIRDTETDPGTGTNTSGGVIQPGGVVNGIPITSLGSVFQISATPVSGATSFVNTTDNVTVVRYIERELGNIFDYKIGGKSERISIDTIPRIHEAFWGDRGTSLVIRYLDRDGLTITTYKARLVLTQATSSKGFYKIEGLFLPENISDVSLSSSKNALLYIIPNQLSGSVGFLSSPIQKTAAELFSSPLTEWLSQWPNDRHVILSSKPSQGILGYALVLDTKTGSLNEFVPPRPSLMLVSNPDLSLVLILDTEQKPASYVYNRTTQAFIDLRIPTLPEKCVWGTGTEPGIVYCAVPTEPSLGVQVPDSWLNGSQTFSDELWRFDINKKTAERLVSVNQFTKGTVDVYRPFISDDGKYLIFINKKDLTLWGARIKE